MNRQELIAAGYSLQSSGLTYQIYKEGTNYRLLNTETDVSELYTQDLSKINIFVRIREMGYMIQTLSAQHGLTV